MPSPPSRWQMLFSTSNTNTEIDIQRKQYKKSDDTTAVDNLKLDFLAIPQSSHTLDQPFENNSLKSWFEKVQAKADLKALEEVVVSNLTGLGTNKRLSIQNITESSKNILSSEILFNDSVSEKENVTNTSPEYNKEKSSSSRNENSFINDDATQFLNELSCKLMESTSEQSNLLFRSNDRACKTIHSPQLETKSGEEECNKCGETSMNIMNNKDKSFLVHTPGPYIEIDDFCEHEVDNKDDKNNSFNSNTGLLFSLDSSLKPSTKYCDSDTKDDLENSQQCSSSPVRKDPNCSNTKNNDLLHKSYRNQDLIDEERKFSYNFAIKHQQKKLKQKIFYCFKHFVATKELHRNHIVAQISRNKTYNHKRTSFWSWKTLVLKNKQVEKEVMHNYRVKVLRVAFAALTRSISQARMQMQKFEIEYEWKLKASIMSQWKRKNREIMENREKARIAQEKSKESALLSRACQWHDNKLLTSSVIRWKTFCRVEQNGRIIREKQENYEHRVTELLCRLSEERESSCEEKCTLKNARLLEAKESDKSGSSQICNKDKNLDHHDISHNQMKRIKCDQHANSKEMKNQQHISYSSMHESRKSIPLQIDSNRPKLLPTRAPSNMEIRQLERSKRRKALQERYLETNKKKEEEAMLNIVQKEKAIRFQLHREKKKRENENLAKEREIENRKNQWKLAKIHLEETQRKNAFEKWKLFLQHLKTECKNTVCMYQKRLICRTIKTWQGFIREQQKHRNKVEHSKLLAAEIHSNMRSCLKMWRAWKKIITERQTLSRKAYSKYMHSVALKVIFQWNLVKEEHNMKLWETERKARTFGNRLQLRLALNSLKLCIIHSREERIFEEKVAEKWIQVRHWIDTKILE